MLVEKFVCASLAAIFIFGMTAMLTKHRERMKSLENEARVSEVMQYPLADVKPWYKIF